MAESGDESILIDCCVSSRHMIGSHVAVVVGSNKLEGKDFGMDKPQAEN